MIIFDISQSPPTRQDLDAENMHLERLKKRLIKHSIISDGGHGLALLGLYLSNQLSGYGLLAVIGLGTVIAIIMATTLKNRLRKADLLTVIFVATATAFAVGGTVHGLPNETLAGSILTGLITGSIILFSTLIGRQMLQVFTSLEQMKNLTEFANAEQELRQLCRDNPLLEEYRQQALQILRPNLTLGELQAMRDWVKR
jgi:hypothetical protein